MESLMNIHTNIKGIFGCKYIQENRKLFHGRGEIL